MWWLIISPWAAYEKTSRLKSGATRRRGTIQAASIQANGRIGTPGR
jgi:hypothetical protein